MLLQCIAVHVKTAFLENRNEEGIRLKEENMLARGLSV